jgi:ATP-dependent Clp protease ATP-binding subunit ClpC
LFCSAFSNPSAVLVNPRHFNTTRPAFIFSLSCRQSQKQPMVSVKLQVPTLVSNAMIDGKEHYHLRPLFVDYPMSAHRRYDDAVTRYKKAIRQLFKGFSLDRGQSERLMWYLFTPELKFKLYKFEIPMQRKYLFGTFAAVSFELQGHTFVCLPKMNNYMFLYHDRPGNTLEEECKRVIKYLMREFIKQDEDSFSVSHYTSDTDTFITQVELSISIKHSPFQFDTPKNDWFFSAIMGNTSYDGQEEIEKVGQNLNALYPSELGRAYYQEDLVQQLYQLVYHPVKTPIAIIGPEGVGKHAVLHEMIWRHESGFYEKNKGRKQHIWQIDPTRIISGMSIVGAWQKRLEAIISFLRKPTNEEGLSDKMMIDNPVALLSIGKSARNNMTAADLLRPYLEKRQLQLIMIATPEQWKTIQERGRRFSSLFRVIRLDPPPLSRAIKIILEKRRQLERTNDVVVKIQAIQQLLDLQRNYLRNKPLPGSVLRLMEQMAIKYRNGSIDAPEVREEFRAFSGLQEQIFDATPEQSKQAIAEQIEQELVGQPQAVEALANVVHLLKAKLNNPKRPLSSFLFVGPTGVGKTQAAKVLCRHLMGSEDQLLRFDMNEYIDSGSIQRLIGDDYQPEGQLTGAVRYRPFSILLLDEIEKAHPLVHDLLLQLLDDGRLTNSTGQTVDFTNTIIIMTSNIGASQTGKPLGFPTKDRDDEPLYRRAMEQFFRPEFLNRIDQTVVFNALQPEHILSIARLQINELLQRDGFVRRATMLNISQSALKWVAQRGFDARMGGRALKRQIEKDLTALSADQLIHTPTEQPILMDINLDNDALVPQIRPLDFTPPIEEYWLPEMPDETQGKRFYVKLLKWLEDIRADLDQFEAQERDEGSDLVVLDGQLGWEYYHYKAKLEEVREQIKNISLGFRDRHYVIGPAIPYRLKAVKLIPRSDYSTKGVRENLKDMLFQQEGIKEISDAYQYANVQFDSLKTEFINYFLKVAFLHLQLLAITDGREQICRLQFSSFVEGFGKKEIDYLIKHYAALLTMLDLPHQLDEEANEIAIKTFGADSILQGEIGIHLFYTLHRNPVPIQVALLDEEGDPIGLPNTKVVRIYDKGETLTDLRTGFSNAANITVEEFALLVYAGIDSQLRQQINPF